MQTVPSVPTRYGVRATQSSAQSHTFHRTVQPVLTHSPHTFDKTATQYRVRPVPQNYATNALSHTSQDNVQPNTVPHVPGKRTIFTCPRNMYNHSQSIPRGTQRRCNGTQSIQTRPSSIAAYRCNRPQSSPTRSGSSV